MIRVEPSYWRISPEAAEIVLPHLYLFSPSGNVSSPVLDNETLEKLNSAGIEESDVDLYWIGEDSPFHQGGKYLTTVMKFKNFHHATLFKLAWGNDV